MAKLIYKIGNLTEASEDIIVHGCNCFHTMGAGVARALKEKWPGIYNADLNTKYGNKDKLGTYSWYKTSEGKIIVNMYTQFYYGKGKNVDYTAIERGFRKLNKKILSVPTKTVAIPLIGAGLAGGDWKIISEIIEASTPDIKEITVYKLE